MEQVNPSDFDVLESGSAEVRLLQPPAISAKNQEPAASSSTACEMTTDEEDEDDAHRSGVARPRFKRVAAEQCPDPTETAEGMGAGEFPAMDEEITPPTDTDETDKSYLEHDVFKREDPDNFSSAEMVDNYYGSAASDLDHLSTAADADYSKRVRVSPASSASEGVYRSSGEFTLKIPSVLSYEEQRDAEERLALDELDDERKPSSQLTGKQDDENPKSKNQAMFDAYPCQRGNFEGAEQAGACAMSTLHAYDDATYKKIREYDESLDKTKAVHKSDAVDDKRSDLAPSNSTALRPPSHALPRTDFRWSVSVDGAIPGPPTSLQAGRNFSAPGAFRMYQTGVLHDEPEGSERFPDPRNLRSMDINSATQPPLGSAMAPPPLRSSASASSDSYVVEAQLVREQSHSERRRRREELSLAVVEAKPLEEVGVFRIRRRVLCVTILVIIAIALGMGVWLGQRDQRGHDLANDDVSFPTPAPLPPLRDQFEAALPSYTLAALKEKNSTQSQAYSWALSKDGMSNVTTVDRLLARFALATIYYATGGGSTWKETEGWLTSANECQWYANEFFPNCPDGQTVTQVALYGNGLAGTIPPEVGVLRNLKALILGKNDLTGTIPPQLVQAAMLETFSVYDNQFQDLTGLLLVLRNLRHLKDIDIERNRFKGTIPEPSMLKNLTALRSLYIGSNKIRGSLPSGYAYLPSLTTLSVNKLRLNGSIPTSFARMTNMQIINLSTNRLTGNISDALFDAWKNKMEYLDLTQNRFTGTIGTKIGLLTLLTSLGVNGNRFTGTLPTELGLLTRLTSLALYANSFTGTIPTELGLLTDLTVLYLDGNALTGTIPTELGQLTDLTSIYLNGNALNGTTPEGLCQLKKKNFYSGFDLIINCDQVVCDCDCTCVGDNQVGQRR